ncbi:Ankyrin-1 [Colletotrichum aenigma]|uniref:Ankyrin-1 n=1 Tax=Colletotrichum aenigma TaxID=1215731 RepID=UPI0018725D91|nr:Ankyrin-1 [Colletotrichum aenigma]KAF5518293.1 Ankyrin-1 [Colletotrichum aenigma]
MTPPNLHSLTPPKLQSLPTELLLLIVAGVGDDFRRTALAGLSRTNKSLHATCNPMLYDDAIKKNAQEITTFAARDGNIETLMKAHEYGADLNAVTWVPFPSWAHTKDAHGNDVTYRWEMSENASDEFGFAWATPLAMAVCEGHYHVVKYLMTLHVDVDVPGKFFCKCHIANEILEDWRSPPRSPVGIPWVEAGCYTGVWTPLHFALCRRKTSIARLLISYGASLTNTRYPVRSQIPRGNGIAPLFGVGPVDNQEAATIRKRLGPLIHSLGLLERVQAKDTDSETDQEDSEIGHAIHTAAASGNEAILRRLVLNHNIDINQKDRLGATVLHYALKTESVEMVQCVLSFGANPNVALDKFGNAAEWVLFLNYSRKWARNHLDQIMQALLDSGVSLWTQRRNDMVQPGEMSMTINLCTDWLPGYDFPYAYNGWLERFILGSIAKYDENHHRKLKREKMDLFWSILLNYCIPARALDELIHSIGPIDFMELLSEDTAPPGDDVVSAVVSDGVTIGAQAFQSLTDVSYPLWGETERDRRSILGRIEWISEQGVPLSHKALCLITGIIRKEPYR